MGVHIIIAGESRCDFFAKTCLIADYLAQHLPHFSWKRIEKSVLEWKTWLCKINGRNKWHHEGSPLVWKELLIEGSKPYYIGGASEFLDYCYSYYKFEAFLSTDRFKDLIENINQYKRKHITETNIAKEQRDKNVEQEFKNYVICISGASHPLTMYIISGLLNMTVDNNGISKIYIFDKQYSETFLEFVENECSFVGTNYSSKVVKYTRKMGMALTNCDILIIMDYEPFREELAIGDWLSHNAHIMKELAPLINASASRNMYIVFPNLGPACYNATLMTKLLTSINKKNIVVVTSDLGLEIAPIAAEIAGVPLRNMFCPPVWGFVGVNHLVDIKNTIHKYNAIQPYNRYVKVRSSSLCVGTLTPEFRTMEYLLYFDDNLWSKLLETKENIKNEHVSLRKAVAVVNFVKLWMSKSNPENIITLGVLCNGAFGLTFDGVFSQPVKYIDGFWAPATDFVTPKDPYINILYLEQIARTVINLGKKELPKINSFCPCICSLPKKKENVEEKTTVLSPSKKAINFTE